MPNTKGSALTRPASVLGTDLVVGVTDPDGTPATVSPTVNVLATAVAKSPAMSKIKLNYLGWF
jgi:hypothetical protein